MKSGDLERACTLFDQSIGSASDPKALLQAAVCYRATNRLEDALTILRDLDERGENICPHCYYGQIFSVHLIDISMHCYSIESLLISKKHQLRTLPLWDYSNVDR